MGAVINDRVARYLEFIERDGALDEIVQRMAGGMGECEGLPEICRALDVPYGRVLLWLMADESRYKRYLQALEVQAHALVGETVQIADSVDNDVARDKLRVETRFRLAKHHASKLYGEKVEHNHVVVPVFQVNIVGSQQGGASLEGEVIDGEGRGVGREVLADALPDVIGPCIVVDDDVSREAMPAMTERREIIPREAAD